MNRIVLSAASWRPPRRDCTELAATIGSMKRMVNRLSTPPVRKTAPDTITASIAKCTSVSQGNRSTTRSDPMNPRLTA